jgi:hypothetical protein
VATDEALALFIRVRAQMMARYVGEHEVIRMVEAGGAPFLQQADGAVVGFFPLDYVRWTPFLHQRLSEIEKELSTLPGVKGKKMIILGTVSPDAKKALRGVGWEVEHQLLHQLVAAMRQKR